MKVVIEEFVISGENISREQGRVYEVIGLDVVYDSHNIRVYSTNKARIMSLGGGIHIHALYTTQKKLSELGFISKDLEPTQSPFEIFDNLGNKILITFIGEQPNNSIAIITSGGDAPGMNAAIKGIIRSACKFGSTVYGVYRGFDGLIEDYICKLGWDTETHSSAEGGTVLLSFRSKSFFKREVRKEAVFNLVKRNINCLIILGGDGSLKGALTLKNEFKSLFRELIKEGRLTQEDLQIIYEKNLNLKKSFMDFDEIEHFEKFYGEPECYKALPKINASKYPPLESNSCKGGGNGSNDDDKGGNSNGGSNNNGNDDNDKHDINSNNKDTRSPHSHHLNENLIYDLKIIGIPSSIDNDIWGTDYTLGADTALNRIIESIDHLSSTMKSHQRIFVIEVMGRSCGWLALMSGLSCLSDYVLIPEDPPEDWRKEVMDKVFFAKNHGKPGIFIVISEGACDRKGIKIPSMDVVNHIASFNIDVRLLKLGHIQRGGPTSAFDRILGTLMGIKAHELSTEMNDNESKIVVYSNGEIQSKNLNTVIEMIDKVGIYEKSLNFREVLNSRGCFYNLAYSFYKEFLEGKSKVDAPFMEDVNLKTLLKDNPTLQKKFESKNRSKMEKINGCSKEGDSSNDKDGVVNGGYKEGSSNEPYNDNNNNNDHFNNFINNRVLLKDKKKIGILQCGSRSSGMNTALNSIIQYSFTVGLEPVYILNGFDGLQQEQIISSKLYEFSTDYNNGGASLGLCGIKYVNLENIKKVLIKKGIENLIIIGDSECLEVVEGICDIKVGDSKVGDKEEHGKGNDKVSSRELSNKGEGNNNNNNPPTFLNIILIPAASSNNIPNTDISLGVDTALNTILRVSDCAKLSTFSMKKNVFVLEVAGGNSGYLTLMGGIAAGAFDCFIPERKYLIGHLSETAHRLRNRYKESKRHGIVIFRNEKTFCSISTESFCRVLKTDGKGLFETDYAVMGRLQQGLNPSPIDRVNATLLGIKAVKCCLENSGGGLVGIEGDKIVFTDIKTVLKNFDLKTRTVKNPKWIKYSNVTKSIE